MIAFGLAVQGPTAQPKAASTSLLTDNESFAQRGKGIAAEWELESWPATPKAAEANTGGRNWLTQLPILEQESDCRKDAGGSIEWASNADTAPAADTENDSSLEAAALGAAEKADKAAAGMVTDGGSFKVEIQVDSSDDDDDMANGNVRVSVQSAAGTNNLDQKSRFTVEVVGDDNDEDDMASGIVKVKVLSAANSDQVSGSGTSAADASSDESGHDEDEDAAEVEDEEEGDDDDDGMVDVMVHRSLLG